MFMSSIANNSDVHAFVSCEGLTDKMRADFNIMKDLASHTRLSPEQRESRINRLVSNINKYRFYMSPIDVIMCQYILSTLTPTLLPFRNADVQNELTTWGLSFENRLLSLNGRVLPSERIIQGGRAVRKLTSHPNRHFIMLTHSLIFIFIL